MDKFEIIEANKRADKHSYLLDWLFGEYSEDSDSKQAIKHSKGE